MRPVRNAPYHDRVPNAPAALLACAALLAGCSRGPRPGESGGLGVLHPPGTLATPTGIRVVDFHAHWDPHSPATMLDRMDQAGIAVAVNYSGGLPRLLPHSVQAERDSGGRLRFFCNVPWSRLEEPDFVGAVVAHLRDCKRAGALGLKISKALGLGVPDPATGALLAVDDPWLDPIFEEAGRLGFPVSIHTGDPQAFFRPCGPDNERFEELTAAPEWCFADRSIYPAWEDLYAAFLRRVARHPDTVFVGVHFGNAPEEPARVGAAMREHANLWIDTAARLPEIGRRSPEEVRAVFSEFPDRVLFGTDLQVAPDLLVLGAGPAEPSPADVETFWRSTWRYFETADTDIPSPTPIQGRWTLRGLALDRDALERFYHRNAERLLGL